MVRTYKKKTDRAFINEDNVQGAINAIGNGMKVARAAAEYGVKRTTLMFRLKKSKLTTNTNNDSGNESDNCEEESRAHKFGSKYSSRKVFTAAQEKELVQYLTKCCLLHYGLSRKQLRTLAFDYAQFVKSPNIPPSWITHRKAGLDWISDFGKRNSEVLSLRKPENTSLARATAFNKPRVEEFFSNLRGVLERYKFKPEQIFNVDESGLNTVTESVKVYAPKKTKQVGAASSAERGEQTTIVGIICAAGSFLPPVYVFPRVTQKCIDDMMSDDGGPPGSLGLGTKNGWMTAESFLRVLQHIKKHSKCSTDNCILLLLDNHSSHISYENIEYCKKNGIVLLSFPPHCSHKLQPLDVAVFGPLKSRYRASIHDWLASKPGLHVKLRHIPKLSRDPFLQSFTPANIIKGFLTTGIYPLNSNIFPDSAFLPSAVTDTEITGENTENLNLQSDSPAVKGVSAEVNSQVDEPSPSTITTEPLALNQCTEPFQQTKFDELGPSTSKMIPKLTPETIRPFPKRQMGASNRRQRSTNGSTVYTNSPEMKKIKLMMEEKEKKSSLKKKNCKTKRKIFPKKDSSDSDSAVDDIEYEESLQQFQFLIDSDKIEKKDYILVQFQPDNNNKSKVVYFIGEVVGYYGLEEYKVSFLRRQGKTCVFKFPLVIDEASVARVDIIAKLLPTRSTRNIFSFNYDFSLFYLR